MAQPQQHQKDIPGSFQAVDGTTYLTNAEGMRAYFDTMDPPEHLKARFEGVFEQLEQTARVIFPNPDEPSDVDISQEQRVLVLTNVALELITDYITFVPGEDGPPLYHPLEILEQTGLKGLYIAAFYLEACGRDARKFNMALAAMEGCLPPNKAVAPILSAKDFMDGAEGLKTFDFTEIERRLLGGTPQNPVAHITERGVMSSLNAKRGQSKRPKLG